MYRKFTVAIRGCEVNEKGQIFLVLDHRRERVIEKSSN